MNITCKNCGTELSLQDEQIGKKLKCPSCGIMFIVTDNTTLYPCPSCGSVSRTPARFCSRCGSPMIGSVKKVQDSPRPSISRQIIWLIAKTIFFAVMLGVCATALYSYFLEKINEEFGLPQTDTQQVSSYQTTNSIREEIKEGGYYGSSSAGFGIVDVKCPYCNATRIFRYMNDYGEKIVQNSDRLLCFHCLKEFRIPRELR